MVRYAEFQVDGETIKVETDDAVGHGEIKASKTKEVMKHAHDAFDQAMDTAKASSEQFIKMVKKLSTKPSKLEIEFGLKLDAEAGAVIAKAATGAHYTVKLTWESKPDKLVNKSINDGSKS